MGRFPATCLAATFALVGGLALWSRPAAAHGDAVGELARRSAAFLQGLRPEQRTVAQRRLHDAERTAWAFVPGRYAGIELGALDRPQRDAARDLLAAMLSAAGLAKVEAIVGQEAVLKALEQAPGVDTSHRDPNRYALLLLGEPAADGTFAVRFQGHHVSLQTIVVDGQLAGVTPHFLGSNPHQLPKGHGVGRVLGAEEDLARAFLLLLRPEQRAKAVLGETAPADVLLGPGRAPADLGPRRGIAWRELDEVQRGVLWRLLEEFAKVHRGDFAELELARIRNHQLDELSFAWAGGVERGQGHYYRLHGARFAIEYDNTQNGANHVHTVWRDFERDFGGDPLREHVERQHGRR